MRFIQNPKALQVIIFFLLLVSGLSIMAKIETEVKLSKTITILHGVESENQMLKTKIIELSVGFSELKKLIKRAMKEKYIKPIIAVSV